jgi:hypothetical protein
MIRFLVFSLGLAAALVVSSVVLSARNGVEYPRASIIERDPEIDPVLVASLAEEEPDLVLLGNSMLGEGVDEVLFSSLTGKNAYKLGINGAASAVWYLVIKNVIAPLDDPPEAVVLFFRDSFLTQPGFRVDGKYFAKVERYAGPGENLLDRLAYLDGMSRGSYFATKWLPLYGEREDIRARIVGTAKFGMTQQALGADSLAVELAIAGTFADSNMNPDLLTAAQLEAESTPAVQAHFDFAAGLDKSFLPEMVGILREKDIDLVLVRVKRRRDLRPDSRPAELETYIEDLSGYLAAKGVPFLDYTNETSLAAEHFGKGDHLNESGREVFTRLLAGDLRSLESASGGGK